MSQTIQDPLEEIHAKKLMDANEFQRALGDFPAIVLGALVKVIIMVSPWHRLPLCTISCSFPYLPLMRAMKQILTSLKIQREENFS